MAHDKSVPLEILEERSGCDDAVLRHSVAGRRKLSPALFERLARDAGDAVRTAIACNAKPPPAILERLLQASDKEVPRAALYHWEHNGDKSRRF